MDAIHHETLDCLEGSLKDCVSKVQALEDAAPHTSSHLDQLETDYNLLNDKHELLLQKTLSLENHSRKFNLLILGIKQGAEKGKQNSLHPGAPLQSVRRSGDWFQPATHNCHCVGLICTDKSCPTIARFHSLENKMMVPCL